MPENRLIRTPFARDCPRSTLHCVLPREQLRVREMINQVPHPMPDYEVAVVGAGVVGAAIAYELAARRASVILLDSRAPAMGSTQAAAGMLVPYVEGFGGSLLPHAAQSLAMYDGFIDRVTRDSNTTVTYKRTGSLHVATADESLDELERLSKETTAAGIESELLDAPAARRAEPRLTPDVSSALLIRSHGYVLAADLTRALAQAATIHGARVRSSALIDSIRASNGGVELHMAGERLHAGHVVLAAGSWSGHVAIDGVPPLPVKPIRGQLVQVASAEPELARIVWGARCYIVPAGPGAILIGATIEDAGFDERTTIAGVHDLLDAACDLVPHLWQASFVEARVGLRPATSDGMPIIGRSKRIPGLVFATGHYRNGVLMAPLTAQVVADLVLHNREHPLLAHTSPHRFGEY